MKKIMIICAGLIILSFTTTKAQTVLDKIDKATEKADRAGRTADRTKSTGEKILGLFSKKKDGAASATKTTIRLSGVDFVTLKSLNEKLQSAKGIESTKMNTALQHLQSHYTMHVPLRIFLKPCKKLHLMCSRKRISTVWMTAIYPLNLNKAHQCTAV